MEEDTTNENKFILELPEHVVKPKILYMKQLIQASRLINMWPWKNKTFWYHLTVWLAAANYIFYMATMFLKISHEGSNMDKITETIDFLTVFISATFRFLYVYFRGEKYVFLVGLIHNQYIYNSFFPNEKGVTLEKFISIARRIIRFYGIFTISWIVLFCVVPLLRYAIAVNHSYESVDGLNNTAPLVPYPIPMSVYVPFDVTTQPANAIFYLYQSFAIINFGCIYVIVDSFWYMVILLTIGQFALIKESIDVISDVLKKEETSKDVDILEKWKIVEVENGLQKCIKHHQFTRECVRLIDNILNPNILVDSLHAIISIAFILLDVTIALNNGDLNKVLSSLEYFVTSITHMYFFDWMGNELAVKEEEIAEAIYGVSWYRIPSLKIHLQLMLAQSRRPRRLTGGNMYKLSLEFFGSTVKAIFSYFTFLLQMRNKTPTAI